MQFIWLHNCSLVEYSFLNAQKELNDLQNTMISIKICSLKKSTESHQHFFNCLSSFSKEEAYLICSMKVYSVPFPLANTVGLFNSLVHNTFI